MTSAKPWLSIVMPVFNEASVLPAVLDRLQPWREQGAEIILADGGSQDDSLAVARHRVDHLIEAPVGRARQMNAGAALASADFLLFLHADTVLPDAAVDTLRRLAARSERARPWCWGRFDVRIVGRSPWLAVVGFMMNWRSRLTRVSTGDQALFMDRPLFDAVGGFPDQPLMEDVEICKRLRSLSAPVSLRLQVSTSGRRWDANGAWFTILLMWRLRWLYFRGESPQHLAELYRNSRRQ
jgi:rSAM/selenodomain-associated transferase 2